MSEKINEEFVKNFLDSFFEVIVNITSQNYAFMIIQKIFDEVHQDDKTKISDLVDIKNSKSRKNVISVKPSINSIKEDSVGIYLKAVVDTFLHKFQYTDYLLQELANAFRKNFGKSYGTEFKKYNLSF